MKHLEEWERKREVDGWPLIAETAMKVSTRDTLNSV